MESTEPDETGKVSKPKAKAKAKAGSLRPSVSSDFELDEHLLGRFVAYGQQCYSEDEKFSVETKKRLRSCLSTFEHATLIIYWTRPAVALKFRSERNKDFFYNAFPCPDDICYRIHMLVSIQVGIEMVPCFRNLRSVPMCNHAAVWCPVPDMQF